MARQEPTSPRMTTWGLVLGKYPTGDFLKTGAMQGWGV